MGRIQANTGLVTGIDIQGTVDKLIALQAQPRDRLAARLKEIQSRQTAITDLTASVIGVQLAVKNLGTSSTFSARSISSSNSGLLTGSVGSTTPANGSYQFTPVRLVEAQQLLSRGFASSSSTVGAGSITIRRGGTIDRGVSLSGLNGGEGVERGKIKITDRSGSTAVVDLRFANTIDDVLDAINSAEDIDVTAVAEGDRIRLTDNTGLTDSNLRVREVGSTTTAADLGLASIDVAASSALGDDIVQLFDEIAVNTLNDGQGLSINSVLADLQITFRDTSSPLQIDFRRQARSASNATATTNAASGINGDIALTADTVGADYDGVQLVFTSSGSVTQGNETVSYDSVNKVLTVDIADGASTADDVINAINNDPTASPLFTAARGAGSDGTGLVNLADAATLTGGAELEARNESTLAEILETLNTADPTRLSASLSANGDRIVLTDLTSNQGGSFTVTDLNGGSLASDLGFATTASGGTLTGERLLGGLRSPLLRSLKGGQGITEGVLTLTDRTGATANVSLAGAETLDDVLTALNASGLDITASVNEARTGIVLRDTSGATSSNLIVANGDANNVATQLGLVVNAAVTEIDGGTLDLQTLSEATLLSELPFSSSTPSGSFTVTDSSGATGAVNLTTLAATTLGDVIDAINDLGIGVAARINNTGDGLLLTDTAGGSGVLTVNDSGSGTAAAQLNIAGEATGTTLDGAFSKTITLSAEDTLADLVEQINAISGGLTASLINDGSTGLPVRISLASSIAGARGNFTIDDGGLGLGIEEVVEGRDALLALGAGATLLASSSNSFTDVVSGLNVSLKEASTQAVTITVATDSASIRGRVSAFVDQYNRFRDKLETYDFFNETDGSKGILFGTTEALRLSSDLSNAISRRYFASSEISYFTALGVSFTDDGNLEFDAAQFDEVYAGNPAAVEAFFTDAEKGFSEEIDRVAESLAGIDNSALISSAFTLQDKASILQERIDFLDARLERTEERLLLQFYNLELAVSKLQNTFGSIQSALTNATNFFNSVSR